MLLYIIRHAFAGEHGDPRYPDDSQRPLTEEGRKRFVKVVEALADRGFAPTVIATSPYVRCRQTADVAAQKAPSKPKVVPLSALEPGSNLDAVLQWSVEQNSESIAWCGHAPDVDVLAAEMLGEGRAGVRFAKGAVACLKFEDTIAKGKGVLQWLVTAKVLGL